MRNTRHYAICLNNDDYPVSLEKGRVYPVLDSLPNDPEGYLRIVDESGEDYLFVEDRFHVVLLPDAVATALDETQAA